MVFALEKFKWFIENIKKEGIKYYVFGGFAIDGLRGSLIRDHNDLDILIFDEDKASFIRFLNSLGLKGKWSVNNKIYSAANPQLNLEVLFLGQDGDFVKLDGEKAEHKIPKELFKRSNKGKIKDFEFSIMPREWLIESIIYCDHKEDREFLLKLVKDADINLIKKMSRISKRKLDHPKLKIYEQRRQELKVPWDLP